MIYLYYIGKFIALYFPLRVGYAIAYIASRLYYFFSVTDKSELIDNIKIVVKDASDKECLKISKNVFMNFALYLFDFFRIPNIDMKFIDNNISIEGRENLDEALKKYKGVIIISSHLGNWELGAAVLSLMGYPVNAIVLDHKDKKVNDFFIKQRQSKGVNKISINIELKKCFKVLKENKILAILGDRDFSENGERLKFFGKETLLPKGPAVFSLRTGAPIVPAFLIRNGFNRYRFIFEKQINHERTNNEKEDMNNLIMDYTAVIEKFVRHHPDQWYVFRSVWNHL